MNELECGYVTVVIDGEGYIGIGNDGRQMRMVATSTNEELCRKLAQFTGLGYSKPCRRKNDSRRIPSWQWLCLKRKEVVHILRRIRPHLIINESKLNGSSGLRTVWKGVQLQALR